MFDVPALCLMILPVDSPAPPDWIARTGSRLVETLKSRASRDHGWLPVLATIRGWVERPDETVLEEGDAPISRDVLDRALNSALSLYEAGGVAPTAVVPSCEGYVAFEKHDSRLGADETGWRVCSLRILPENRIAWSVTESNGKVTTGGPFDD